LNKISITNKKRKKRKEKEAPYKTLRYGMEPYYIGKVLDP
jgi:hypothetical protein